MTAGKVLVADDEPDMRLLLRARLSREGWEVHLASDGDDALDVWRAQDVAAAVLDQQMPGRTGIETAAALRERGFHGPIVLFSAYLDADLEQAAYDAGIATLAKGEIRELGTVLSSLVSGDG